MNKIKKSTSDIKSWAIVVLPYSICIGSAILASYVPVLRTLPDDVFSKFLTDRLKYLTLAGPLFSGCFTVLVVSALSVVSKYKGRSTAHLWWHALLPYFFLGAFFGWMLMHVPAEKAAVSGSFEAKDLYELFEKAFPADPVMVALANEVDLLYYWAVAGIGLIFLACFRPLHIHFNRLVRTVFSRAQDVILADKRPVPGLLVQEEVEDVTLLYGNNEELLEAAADLANTYAQDPSSEEPHSFGLDKVAFVYGEDCIYSIVKQGFAIPTVFDDGETIESLYEGAFLHINKTLYIRFDQITFFDFDNLKIGVSPALIQTFHQLNRPSIKEKVWSYRSAASSENYCFDIHPDLVAKLKRMLDEDD